MEKRETHLTGAQLKRPHRITEVFADGGIWSAQGYLETRHCGTGEKNCLAQPILYCTEMQFLQKLQENHLLSIKGRLEMKFPTAQGRICILMHLTTFQ